MGLLPRHFLWQYVRAFVASLLILALAVSVVDTLLELDELLAAPGGLEGAALAVLLRLPSRHLLYLIPIASFVAAFLVLGGAARHAEILALKAGGVSPLRVALPLLGVAAALAAGALALNESFAVRATHALERAKHGSTAQVTFRGDSFWYHRGRFVYNVRDADPERRMLRGVAVFELDERGRLVRAIHAERAEITAEGDWRLERATIRRFDPERPEAAPGFERVAETRVAFSTEPDLALLQASVSELSIRDLQAFLASPPADETGVVRARALLNERLTEPLASLLFALLAIPLGLGVERTRGFARPALQGVALLSLFYLLRDYGSTLALQGVTPPAATPWAILATFGAFGVWRLARVPR